MVMPWQSGPETELAKPRTGQGSRSEAAGNQTTDRRGGGPISGGSPFAVPAGLMPEEIPGFPREGFPEDIPGFPLADDMPDRGPFPVSESSPWSQPGSKDLLFASNQPSTSNGVENKTQATKTTGSAIKPLSRLPRAAQKSAPESLHQTAAPQPPTTLDPAQGSRSGA